MAERTLNIVQVATMLVSTSCGIGFLLGTGELAVHHGMAGCLYAVSTAVGLMLLAIYAPTLWTSGESIWIQFDQLYGRSVGRSAALLSLVWMAGVLAAQIRGGSAVLALIGVPRTTAMALIVGLLVALSLVSISWLSASFAFCLLACNLVLAYSLVHERGLHIWLRAPLSFANAMKASAPSHAVTLLLTVAMMVMCGADYQQFALAARKPSTARAGCLLAAAIVFVMAFLPASAIIAARISGDLHNLSDPLQVVPVLLMHAVASQTTGTVRDVVVIVLVTTALGSASSILRAMSDATGTLGPSSVWKPLWSRALPTLLGSLVALRSQSLVDMMVELNVVYIAAVGPLLALSVLRFRVSDGAANAAMAIACAISLGEYVIRWTGAASLPETATFITAIVASFVAAISGSSRTSASQNDYLLNASRTRSTASAQPRAAQSPPGYAGDAGGD